MPPDTFTELQTRTGHVRFCDTWSINWIRKYSWIAAVDVKISVQPVSSLRASWYQMHSSKWRHEASTSQSHQSWSWRMMIWARWVSSGKSQEFYCVAPCMEKDKLILDLITSFVCTSSGKHHEGHRTAGIRAAGLQIKNNCVCCEQRHCVSLLVQQEQVVKKHRHRRWVEREYCLVRKFHAPVVCTVPFLLAFLTPLSFCFKVKNVDIKGQTGNAVGNLPAAAALPHAVTPGNEARVYWHKEQMMVVLHYVCLDLIEADIDHQEIRDNIKVSMSVGSKFVACSIAFLRTQLENNC